MMKLSIILFLVIVAAEMVRWAMLVAVVTIGLVLMSQILAALLTASTSSIVRSTPSKATIDQLDCWSVVVRNNL